MTVAINLLPWREAQKEQKKKEFFTMMGISAGACVALMVVIHLIIGNEIKWQQENNSFIKKEIQVLDRKIAEIEGLQKEKERLLARMDIIQQLQSNRPHIVRLFDVIVKTIPDGLYLVSLTRAEGRILLEGKAESNTRVSKFMRNIQSSEWLHSPNLSFIQADAGQDTSIERLIGFNLQAFEQKIEVP